MVINDFSDNDFDTENNQDHEQDLGCDGEHEKSSKTGETTWTPDQLEEAVWRMVPLDILSKDIARQEIKKESGYSCKTIDACIKRIAQEHQRQEREMFPEHVEYSFEQKQAANELARAPNLFEVFPSLLDSLDYITAKWRAQSLLLVLGLTLLDKERLICFWGDTGDGKTEAAQIILNLLDYERHLDKVKEVLDCSPEWIKYAGGEDGMGLKHRLVFFDEMNPVKPGQDDRRQELIRQLDNDQSRVARFEIVDRTEGKQIGVRSLQLEKPIYLLITSITPPHKWDPQNRSRFIFVEFSLTPDQVESAQRRIARPTLTDEKRKDVFKSFNCFLHEKLKRQDFTVPLALRRIEIPFLDQLIKKEPDGTGADIRRFKLLKSSIQASALLHQRHREMREDEKGQLYLTATWQDYYNIREVFQHIVPRVTQPAGMKYLDTFKKVAWWLYNNPVKNRKQIKDSCKISKAAMEGHLKDLVEVGLLTAGRSPNQNDKWTYYQVGPRLVTVLEDVRQRTEKQRLAEEALFTMAVDRVVSDVEAVNTISAAADPSPLMSPNGRPGASNASMDEAFGDPPQSLAGCNGEEDFSPALMCPEEDFELD